MSLPSLYQLLNTPIDQPLCLATLAPFLSAPPWHEASGVFNLRNVFCLPYVKQDFVYRSGMLSFVTGEGKKAIQDALVIKAIFDLRSYEERVTDPGPDFAGLITSYAHNEDIDRVPTEDTQWQSSVKHPVSTHSEAMPFTGRVLSSYTDAAKLVEMYSSFLTTHRRIYREIFLHVLQKPSQAFLVHCTAGKDRTAVAIALLLSVARVPREVIVHDYTLTRIGIEPVRELLQAKLAEGEGELDWSSKAVKTVAGCGASTMVTFLETIDNAYEDGIEGYIRDKLQFTTDDMEGIRRGLMNKGS